VAITTDFFVAEPEELRRAFVGWRRPAAQREKRTGVNPFTGEPKVTLTWVADPADDARVEPLPGATLGQRLSRFPHATQRDLDPAILAELLMVTLGGAASEWLDRIGEPPPLVNVDDARTEHLYFWELPEAFVAALADCDHEALDEIGARWAACPDTEWTEDDCADIVHELRGLVDAMEGTRRRMYYWV